MPSLCNTVDIHADVNDIKSLSISMDTQEWIPFALLSSNKIFRSKLDFCLTVHHQLGKVIQKNQLDTTMIY